ncbi:hypothetical protein BCR33DRAFT_714174, partial [Rhizoclosmatium globosum]
MPQLQQQQIQQSQLNHYSFKSDPSSNPSIYASSAFASSNFINCNPQFPQQLHSQPSQHHQQQSSV